MAKKKSKKNRIQTSEPVNTKAPTTGGGLHAARETIESVVIAFVLAFLFRTFEAEAFVIPTGSMSPALQGQHKDVHCSECGYRFRANASSEGDERQQLIAHGASRQDVASLDVLAGQCPMCRQTMLMRPDVHAKVPSYINDQGIEHQKSYPGDRILVNKFIYNYSDPKRWDVVVFKYPGNGDMNYIKRLVGLPNETLRIEHGDLFVRPNESAGEFQIARKPADKVQAMLQPVHDTDYDPAILYNAGWPLRWQSDSSSGWQVETEVGKQTVQQHYQFQPSSTPADGPLEWLRYQHLVPQDEDWAIARKHQSDGKLSENLQQRWLEQIHPELIRDFNPYNTTKLRGGASSPSLKLNMPGVLDSQKWDVSESRYNLHWVGDLAVDCEVDIEQAQGELVLELVEAGKHFTCSIELSTGIATVAIQGSEEYSATGETKVQSPGDYQLRFANVDDQLLLWVDGQLIELGQETAGLTYDTAKLHGQRKNALPVSNEDDLGDLAPAAIGARGTTLTVNRIQVLRDIYYIAVKWTGSEVFMSDYSLPVRGPARELFTNPDEWSRFEQREAKEFRIGDDQLFVMGDNSPASQDCRLWSRPSTRDQSHPGGPYLDRRLLIGKAVCVFWPHSWGEIPGASKLPGFPNFGDMRLVR